MSANAAFCCDEHRRNAVAVDGRFNGIDWLEVVDRDAPDGSPRQRTLLLRCLKPVATLDEKNIAVVGGERVRHIKAEWAHPASAVPALVANAKERAFFSSLPFANQVLVVRVDRYGDASPYVLRIVRGMDDALPPADFDPLLAEVTFSFKVECDNAFDCAAPVACAASPSPEPAIDYLAKDYASFRRLLLDRLRQLLPEWHEKSAADTYITLVELLAYLGDLASYRQDAMATEAYLATARSRISLRRHAMLVDYPLDEGCNARAWLHLHVSADGVKVVPGKLRFFTRVDGVPPGVVTPATETLARVLLGRPETFEPLFVDGMASIPLFRAHNEIGFYTWGERGCCLPRGATRATLVGHQNQLAPGMALLFEETKGPRTGLEADADARKRHVVRLTQVEHTRDNKPLADLLTGVQITEIAWHAGDALPFALCLSVRLDKEHGGQWIDRVSIARGNMMLVDHGATIDDENLGQVPAPTVLIASSNGTPCEPAVPVAAPPRFAPWLQYAPVARVGQVRRKVMIGGRWRMARAAFDPADAATAALRWQAGSALPEVRATSTEDGKLFEWTAQPDLLDSAGTDRHLVVETDTDGRSRLRFGDGVHAMRPATGIPFSARYRAGNGIAGNVGAEAIAYVVTNDARILRVRNPMPATGGRDPETVAQIRRHAPEAFRRQQRAVTPEDYADFAKQYPTVQKAAASPRWTGSWHTMFVDVDRVDAQAVDSGFREGLRDHLERYRMAGHDVEIDAPVFVSLEVTLAICVMPGCFRADVVQALLAVFSSGVLPDGRTGYFHPDRYSFGDTVFLSPILAAAHRVPGVLSATASVFKRQAEAATDVHVITGYIGMGRLEIPRLDNDPDFPERGVFRIQAHGGK